MAGILSFIDARREVEQRASALCASGTEVLPLLQARGRVLAEPVLADRDFPPFPRATRDGFALRSADLATVPVRLEVVGEIRAGAAPQTIACPLATGECAEIMTGAPVPSGADAVVMVEHTERQGERLVIVQRAVEAGENMVPRGAEARQGSPLLSTGSRIDYAAIALAAGAGKTALQVFTEPRVAILATGDELVELSAELGPHQIRNSNSYSLAAQVAAAGAQPVVLPIAPDNAEALRELISRGLECDLLLLSGGVSMGKYDLVEESLARFGAEFFFTGAQIQPGRPLVFGQCQPATAGGERKSQKLFFGLPGNPVSTMVCFELFVRAVINALSGASPRPLRFVHARLKQDFKTKTGLTRFLPAVLTGEFDHCEVEPVKWQGSGDMAATARANCYLVVPPDRKLIAAGEMVSILPKS